MNFPKLHWTKLHSTDPIERLNGESKKRTDVVGIFPNKDAIVRPVGAMLLEQNDERAVQRSSLHDSRNHRRNERRSNHQLARSGTLILPA